jgi:hypothetical protein
MRCSLFRPLAAALLLAVASSPCPAARLNDTTCDVGVEEVLAPRGTVDSGQTIHPRCVVANYGDSTASLWTFFRIDDGTPSGYSDSLWLPALAPSRRETLAFHSWVPHGRDSMEAIAWTECEGDTNPANDTCRQRFLVRVKDVAILLIIKPVPDTVYDSGVTFYPQCLVWNYGNTQWDTIVVRFQIGSSYSSACTLYNVHADTATAHDPYTTMPGIWACRVFAIVVGDLHPENNLKVDTFTVTGTMFESLWVRVLIRDTVDTTLFTPRVRYGNAGVDAVSFEAYLSIYDSAGTKRYYADSSPVLLGASDSLEICFQNARIREPGAYLAIALGDIEPIGRMFWDSLCFWVVPSIGIQETPPQATSRKVHATVLRLLPPGAVVFDATGRRVLNPKSGICFLAEGLGARGQGLGRIRKVILQR